MSLIIDIGIIMLTVLGGLFFAMVFYFGIDSLVDKDFQAVREGKANKKAARFSIVMTKALRFIAIIIYFIGFLFYFMPKVLIKIM